MAWFLGGVAVLILLVFAAGFRRVAIGLVAIVLAIGGSLFVYNRQEAHRALTRIPDSEVVIENVTLKPYVGGYKLAGRITNKSAKFSIKQIDFAVTVQDCHPGADAQQCVTIGESKEILNLDIPPGEAREFEEGVRFSGSNLKVKGRLDWKYSVSGIRAE